MKQKTLKIAISSGHHEDSKGATNLHHGLNEFDEAEKVNIRLIKLLIDAGHDAQLINGTLGDKVRRINAGKFDLALDIHFNADYDHLDPDDMNDERGHGAMVMYCPKAKYYGDKEPKSKRRNQASLMSKAFSEHLGNRDLGGRPGWYWGSNPPTKKDYFLSKTNCPALIPEPGYIDNNGFCGDFLVNNRHNVISQAIFNGIIAAFGAGKGE